MRLFKKTKVDEIVDFSKEIQKIINISDSELLDKVLDYESIVLGEYRLIFTSRNLAGIWHDIIEVVPKELFEDHGYLNTKHLKNGEKGWHYIMAGTCTQCLPPKEVRDEVISLLKEKFSNTKTHTGKVVYQKSEGDCVCCEGDEHVFSKYVDFGSEDNVKDLMHKFLNERKSIAEGKELVVTFELK